MGGRSDGDQFAKFILKCEQALPFLANAVVAPKDGKTDSAQFSAPLKKIIQCLRWMYEGYETALSKMNVLDFDDQKLRAYRCLEANRDILSSVQHLYDEVIVDEFQDINRLDFCLVKTIAAKATLVVVGDDDQAIYGFRGCSPEYIINLKQHLGQLESEFELSKNYRCPPNVVDHANRLIRFNQNRIPKNPTAVSSSPATITVESTATAGLEAKYVVEFIRKVRGGKQKFGFNDFAVLYRTNAQSLPLQVEFILNDIPYWVREEDNILENEGLAKFLAVLRVRYARREGKRPDARDVALMVASYFRWVSTQQIVFEICFAVRNQTVCCRL